MNIDNDWTENSADAGVKILVINPHPFPVLANSDGRMLGGHTNAIVFESDKEVVSGLMSGMLIKLAEIENVTPEPKPTKRKGRPKKQTSMSS